MKSLRDFRSGGLPTKNDVIDSGGGRRPKVASAATGGGIRWPSFFSSSVACHDLGSNSTEPRLRNQPNKQQLLQ